MVLHRKHLMCFPKVTEATPAISDLKAELSALESLALRAQKEAAEQEHAEKSVPFLKPFP